MRNTILRKLKLSKLLNLRMLLVIINLVLYLHTLFLACYNNLCNIVSY